MYFFYAENILTDDTIILDREESRHCIRSLRNKMGDQVYVTDGKGTLFVSEIIDDNMNQTSLKRIRQIEAPYSKKHHLRMAVSPLKNPDRFEWFVEKAVEIGIDEIIPIICHRTEKNQIKTERLNRIALAAMKQSQKTVLPKIQEPLKIQDFLNVSAEQETKVIAWCETSKEKGIQEVLKNSTNISILIGPEGDFTKEEVDLAILKGFIPVSLGPSRFRSETAAVLACHHAFLAQNEKL